ncbi:MAG: fatty acyl-AMP ligase [Gloeocapsa sp. DLM2.Bin57]|nr:MAG: fatty acyl-AMP ligase [Gloeocapsa sp. DLM2.Bin57]
MNKQIPTTLVELLRHRAQVVPNSPGYIFLVNGKKPTPPLTYGELDRQARAIAAWLQQYSAYGERVLLLYPQGLEVVAAFCGCLYAGAIAIPTPPPESGRLKRTLPRLSAIVRDAQATFVLTTQTIIDLVANVKEEFPEFEQMQWLDTTTIDLNLAPEWVTPAITKDELAYLQYTSGSTSTPKGVMLSHFNLMYHANSLQTACGYDSNSLTLTWMPYFHDYGLVEGITVPLYNGTPCYLMSPFAFIKKPLQWLQNISEFRVTHSQAPNFAYDLCVRRYKSGQTLDLSCWEAAGNAAEPINPKVMKEFYHRFSSYGFRWSAFAPAYGLAENTLLASSKPKGTDPVLLRVDSKALEQGNIIIAPSEQTTGVKILVSCGRLVGTTQCAIVNPDTFTPCQPTEVGEIWLKDPSVTQGYWQREEETQATFQAYLQDNTTGPFLRTGDLGFYLDGELYITGRLKDLIIIHGTNHYPQDLEWTVQKVHPALRPDYGAVFSITKQEEEKVVIIQELERGNQDLDLNQLLGDIREAIASTHELSPYAILLSKPGHILKTASGKIQRRSIKNNFLADKITYIAKWIEDHNITSPKV